LSGPCAREFKHNSDIVELSASKFPHNAACSEKRVRDAVSSQCTELLRSWFQKDEYLTPFHAVKRVQDDYINSVIRDQGFKSRQQAMGWITHRIEADTSGAIEAYHAVIKERFLGEKKRKAGRRIDWLLNKLLEHAVLNYEHKYQARLLGLEQNKKNINRTVLAITHARSIPDENVTALPGDGSGEPLGDGVLLFSVNRPGHRVYVVRGLQLPGCLPSDFLSSLYCNCVLGLRVGPYLVYFSTRLGKC
jgi:hypothetical protein